MYWRPNAIKTQQKWEMPVDFWRLELYSYGLRDQQPSIKSLQNIDIEAEKLARLVGKTRKWETIEVRHFLQPGPTDRGVHYVIITGSDILVTGQHNTSYLARPPYWFYSDLLTIYLQSCLYTGFTGFQLAIVINKLIGIQIIISYKSIFSLYVSIAKGNIDLNALYSARVGLTSSKL